MQIPRITKKPLSYKQRQALKYGQVLRSITGARGMIGYLTFIFAKADSSKIEQATTVLNETIHNLADLELIVRNINYSAFKG